MTRSPEPSFAPDPTEWILTPLGVAGLPLRIEVPATGLTLGRDRNNAVALPGELHPGVSSRHARLRVEGDALVLEDLGSRNGTFLDGEAVQRRTLKDGDVFELGPGGPNFAVGRDGGTGTVVIRAARSSSQVGARDTAILRVKLGIPEREGVEEMVGRSNRRLVLLTAALTALLIGAGVCGFYLLRARGDRDVAGLRAQTDALATELRLAWDAVRSQQAEWHGQQSRFEAAQRAWEADKVRLEQERARIEQRIEQRVEALAAEGATTSDQLAELYRDLEQTNEALTRFRGLELDRLRLDKVQEVEKTVVMIEARAFYAEARSGRRLYVETAADGRLTPNLDGRGTPLESESTGSGFVVGPQGHVITNAHVVGRKQEGDTVRIRLDAMDVTRQVELKVVFSQSAERRPARLIAFAADGDDDLAILQIPAFDGMPHIPALDFDIGLPQPGSDVYHLGFPLGKRALQEGDKVIASTFKGIASRRVGPFLQVDAAVHPGNSGGPLIDAHGRILGVVTAMQGTGPAAGSSAIGYVIPIQAVRAIWPE